MRFLLVAATVLAHSVPSAGYDRASVLLSDHAVVCSPGTPVATVRHLVETWGALICAVQSDELWAHPELLPWVGVILPPWKDAAEAADSLAAWKARIHLDVAVTTDDPGLAAVAGAAGLRVFTQSSSFQKGAVAIPADGAYLYYDGPSPTFFDRAGYLEARLAESPGRKDGWIALAGTLSKAFRAGDSAAASRWRTLLDATHTADSLSTLEGALHPVRTYAERWRYCLAWWLAPTWKPDTLELFAGQDTEHSLEIHAGVADEVVVSLPDGSSGGPPNTTTSPAVRLTGIRSASEGISVTWNATWPIELSGATPVALKGTFNSVRPGRLTSAWELECQCQLGCGGG